MGKSNKKRALGKKQAKAKQEHKKAQKAGISDPKRKGKR